MPALTRPTQGFRRAALAAALLATGLFASTGAHALSTASAEISSITITLVDTDTADGIDAAIGFGSGGVISGAGVYTLPMSVPLTQWSGDWTDSLLTGDWFSLSAWTNVTFKVNYALSTSTQLAGESSSFDLTIDLAGNDGNGDRTTIHKVKSSSSANGSFDSKSGFMTATFENASAQTALEVGVRMSGSTHGNSVSPVPETESYAMFLAGLAAIGAVARRRRVK